jgi:hypothetical protein
MLGASLSEIASYPDPLMKEKHLEGPGYEVKAEGAVIDIFSQQIRQKISSHQCVSWCI